ncbi:MAG: dihydroorotate dehydrogenase electron transfer subunit [Thermoleophilia bacterium]
MPEALEMTCASGNQLAETSRCRVLESRAMGRFVLLRLQAPRIAACASPGQFVMVDVPDGDFHLRRPVSLFSVHDERITLLIEVRGVGTARLAQLAAGASVSLAGPLGSGFPLEGVTTALLIGGGIGCAPLQYLGDALVARGVAVSAAFGVRDAQVAELLHAFDVPRLVVASEDGSVGVRGTVIDALATMDVPAETVVYSCGPSGMIRAVRDWCAARHLEGYASLEAHMACGTGACHGCVVETARGRLRVCAEGPVFPLGEVLS